MAGWFRKEIKSVEDLRGLKMRLGGSGCTTFERIGIDQALTRARFTPRRDQRETCRPKEKNRGATPRRGAIFPDLGSHEGRSPSFHWN